MLIAPALNLPKFVVARSGYLDFSLRRTLPGSVRFLGVQSPHVSRNWGYAVYVIYLF